MMQSNTFQDDSQIQLRIPIDQNSTIPTQKLKQDLPNANIRLPPSQPHSQQNIPQHMPNIKFNINGMNAELPAALSQRRNSALQSLFNTTSSLGSALNSARGNSNSNNINSARGLADQVNLESTQELRAFATVDIVKINKDRSNQLRMALEDNLKEKEREMEDVQSNYRQQRDEYDKISKRYQEKNSELESEINKQKQYIVNLKEQLRQIESEYKTQQADYNIFEDEIRQAIDNSQEQIEQHQKLISEKENELSVLNSQKKGLQMGIEMQRKVRIQELDMKVIPLRDEREKIQMHIDMIKENLRMLNDVRLQNENEKMMIQEDLYVSESNKIDQVFQREELEGYLEKLKMTNDDVKFITTHYQTIDIENQGWQKIINTLVEDKQKSLLLDLIRELQQYILGMSSGTTDNSVMQSDELEELEYLIEKRKIDHTQSVEIIVEFAQRKLSLNIGSESLLDKLQQVQELIDIEGIKNTLFEISQVEQQMKIIDSKIKIMYNRCQNELKPRFKALTQSQETFQNEISQAQETLNELQDYINELDKEIKNIQDTFEETYKPNNEEYQEVENKLNEIQVEIQEIEYSIDTFKSTVQQNEITKLDAINQKSMRDTEYDQYQQHYTQISTQLKDQLKRERYLQSEGFSNPIIEELQLLVAQAKCDKESASKRLSYVENKMKNSQDSVQHAKQVLENHILQAQQEQLNSKVQNNSNQFNVKRNSALPIQNGNQILYGPTLTSRVSNIQSKAQTLQHGQVLSPSRDESRIEKSRNMSIRKEQTTPAQVNNDQERMHSHYIDQNQSQIMTEMKRDHYSNSHVRNTSQLTQNQSFLMGHSASGVQTSQGFRNSQNQKSQNDIVRYQESSSSQLLNDQSNLSNHLNQYLNINQRSIPIQNLITPRDPLQELQNLKQYNNNYIYETQQQMSAMSNDSINNSTYNFDRKQSVCNETISNFYDTQSSNMQQYSNQQRVPLKQQNSSTSIDGKQQSNTKNIVIPLYTQFKENITPNNLATLNNTNNSFNMRKLSQASNVSQISNQSILNTIQSMNQTGSRPPAVPQSKMYMTSNSSIQMEDTTPRQNMHKTRTASMRMASTAKLNHTQQNNGNNSLIYNQQNSNSRNSSKDSFITQPNKSVQTKIKLQINVNNTGRPIQIGVVDLSKCQQSSKDSQFFESVKPLIDGAQFLVAQDGQYVLKQFYIDFSLMRIFLVNFNGEKEIIMIENIIKPEMPQSTLDQIRQEKNNSPSGHSSNHSSNKKYEFNLIVNIGGQLQRLQILAMTYEELRKWIVGINALLQNKNQLMRLSSNITTISN